MKGKKDRLRWSVTSYFKSNMYNLWNIFRKPYEKFISWDWKRQDIYWQFYEAVIILKQMNKTYYYNFRLLKWPYESATKDVF